MKILFITCSRIGDAVLTTPVLNHIQKNFPRAKVTIAADPLVEPLFVDYPLLDRIIPFKKQPRGGHWLSLWKQTYKTVWDMVIDLRGSAISYTLLAKNRRVWKARPGDTSHKVEQVCKAVKIPVGPTCLWFSQTKLELAKKLIPDQSAYIAVSPAANWIGKQWPVEYFTQVITKLLNQDQNAKVVVLSAPHEKNLIQPLISALDSNRSLILCDGQYNLAEVAAIIQRCKLFIGNDSGLMHMSAAVGTPTIGLFGPSRENNYGPWWYADKGSSPHRVVRIPLSYDELSKQPGFSHSATSTYMDILKPEVVWKTLDAMWNG
jgi:ADP-heptose:LPS heptosyltransferase